MRIPAFCMHCGACFPSFIPAFAGVESRGNIQNCPFCGHMAEIADGIFVAAANNSIRIIEAPTLTIARLRAFGLLLHPAYHQQITLNELEQQAAAIDPQLAKAVRELKKTPLWATLIIVLSLAISRACTFQVDAKLDINDLVSQMIGKSPERIMEGQLQSLKEAKQEEGSQSPDTASRSADKEQ